MDDLLLRDFERRLDEIESYWDHLAASARLRQEVCSITGLPDSVLESLRDDRLTPGLRKVFDYSSIVVALYGSIEEYVERLAEHCIEVLDRSVKRYSLLPLALRKQHERLSIRLADQIAQSNYRGYLSLQSVTENLSGCLADRQSFRMNAEVFALHGANIRLDIVREMFSRISIDHIDHAIESHHLVKELMTVLGRANSEISFYLDDLAARRNVVAHGERPQDVISLAMMPEYFRAIRAFGVALFESALVGMLALVRPAELVDMGKPTAVYKAGRVACFESEIPISLKIGDRLLWKGGQDNWKTARVESLQINKSEHQRIVCEVGVRFGVGMRTRAGKDSKYWLVERW